MKKTKIMIALAAGLYGYPGISNAQDTFSYKSGNNEIILLSESQGTGNTAILIDAGAEIIGKYIPDGTFPNAVNAFLIKRNGKNILVDTGFGTKLFDNLSSAGVNPEDINSVILTHMHGDHIGGMMRDGTKAFPNAKLIIGRLEHDYWTSDERMNMLPENRRGNFIQAREVIAVYSEDLELVDAKNIDEIAPDNCGIHPVAAYGHTPGHMGVMAVCCGSRFLIWGDLTHAMAVQMPHPEIAVTYDVDPQRAIESRLSILEYLAGHEIPFAGMHVAYPGMGTVKANPQGGYIYYPLQ